MIDQNDTNSSFLAHKEAIHLFRDNKYQNDEDEVQF